jgi:hypothetical protein
MWWRSPGRTCAGFLCLCALAGCQNPQQQLSLYAPFGPSAVPPPSLSRVNAAPYYSPPGDSKPPTESDKPGATASSGDNKLSHYDPYRGILLPGGFATTPVAVRSPGTEADAARAADIASNARARPSSEEPIRIVEPAPRGLGSAIESTIARATEGRSSGAVQFQASPPSGAIRRIEAVPATITAAPATELARLPKPPTTTTVPAATTPPNLLSPPSLSPSPASSNPAGGIIIPTKPAEPRKLSLWDDPRDGSRVAPASYSGAVIPNSSPDAGGGSWRQRSQ